ncbi:MAG: hypothetical protein QM775_10350 [Pirellulales bacterium]
MQSLKLLLSLILVGSYASSASAQKVGDLVSVVRRAELGAGERTVAVVDVGEVLTVGAVEADALWVSAKAAGWISPEHVRLLADAERVFNDRLHDDAKDGEALYARGRIHLANERWQAAVNDLTAALMNSTPSAPVYLARIAAFTRLRRFDEALADCADAMRVDPLDHQAYRMRAGIHCEQRNYRDAVADYNLAARLFPQDGALNNDRAWLLATCPDETYRNGEQAVRDAKLACERCGWKLHNRVGTLAAAYAEAGDFDEAVRWQEKAVALTPESRRQAARSRLKLYEAGKPYRELAGLWK